MIAGRTGAGESMAGSNTLPIARAAQINWPHLLLGSRGRISRADWWIGAVSLLVIDGLAAALNRVAGATVAFALGLVFLLVFYSSLAVTAKRLHDRNRRGWWILMFPLGFVVLISLVGTFREDLDPVVYYGLLGTALILAIAAMIELGLTRGTPGPNRYGPDPLAKIRSDSRQTNGKPAT
jgi:uncharacterized membrane protein YhaH (DUF805 family)